MGEEPYHTAATKLSPLIIQYSGRRPSQVEAQPASARENDGNCEASLEEVAPWTNQQYRHQSICRLFLNIDLQEISQH